MGYSVNPEIVRERAELVIELAKGFPQVWELEPDHALTQRKAYSIREVLHVASLFPDQFPELAQADDMFSIHVVRPGRIEARFKSSSTVRTGSPGSIPQQIHGIVTPLTGFKTVAQVGLTTAEECIESWLGHLPSSDPLLLQRTDLNLNELVQLYTFCSTSTPRLMMLVGDEHITISLHEAGVAEIAGWQPPQVHAAPEEFDL